jgi:uncharacterized protein
VLITRFDLYLKFDLTGQITANKLSDFVTTFRSIVIQAFPFVVLGVTISGLIEINIIKIIIDFSNKNSILPIQLIDRAYKKLQTTTHLPLTNNRFFRHFKVSFIGFLMPVCECGNIPVARRFMLRGFSPSETITFLLAAPILNPITIWSTWEAFRDPVILVGRILGGFFIANFVGILMSYKKDQNLFLTQKFYDEICEVHDHEHTHHPLKQFIEVFQKEFLSVIFMLIIGALIAASSQIFLSRNIISAIGQNAFLSIIALILFSFMISVCSSVDAFLAVSFARTFTVGSILSFLVFGPMIDIKILTLMKGSFKTSTLVTITALVTLFSILIGLIVNYLL